MDKFLKAIEREIISMVKMADAIVSDFSGLPLQKRLDQAGWGRVENVGEDYETIKELQQLHTFLTLNKDDWSRADVVEDLLNRCTEAARRKRQPEGRAIWVVTKLLNEHWEE